MKKIILGLLACTAVSVMGAVGIIVDNDSGIVNVIDAVKQGGSATLSDIVITNSATLPSPLYLTSIGVGTITASNAAFTNLSVGGVAITNWGNIPLSVSNVVFKRVYGGVTNTSTNNVIGGSITLIDDDSGYVSTNRGDTVRVVTLIASTSLGIGFSTPIGPSGGFAGYKYDATADDGTWILPNRTTNVVVTCQFGYVGTNQTQGVRFVANYKAIATNNVLSSSQPYIENINCTNSYADNGTNSIFRINIPVVRPTDSGKQISLQTLTPSNGDVYCTNGFYILWIDAQTAPQ